MHQAGSAIQKLSAAVLVLRQEKSLRIVVAERHYLAIQPIEIVDFSVSHIRPHLTSLQG